MKRGIQGKLVVQGASPEPFESFVPHPLPPEPPIEFSPGLLDLMEKAYLALGRLDGLARLLPDLQLFRKRQSKHKLDERVILLITDAERPRQLG